MRNKSIGKLFPVFMAFAMMSAMASQARAQMDGHMPGMKHGLRGGAGDDKRIVLRIPPMMRNHMLSNMRDHLAAVNEAVRLLGVGDFRAASSVVQSKLGTTEEMKRMCGMFGNDAYREMGISFHASADSLSAEIRSRNMGRILTALSRTLDKCVACHDTFRVE